MLVKPPYVPWSRHVFFSGLVLWSWIFVAISIHQSINPCRCGQRNPPKKKERKKHPLGPKPSLFLCVVLPSLSPNGRPSIGFSMSSCPLSCSASGAKAAPQVALPRPQRRQPKRCTSRGQRTPGPREKWQSLVLDALQVWAWRA